MSVRNITIVICSLLIAILLWYLSMASTNYNEVQVQWRQYSRVESDMVNSALSLTSSLGYGGMIHAFKNYVIRGDAKYRALLEQQLSLVDEQISVLKENLPTPVEQKILDEVTQAVNQYRRKIELIAQLQLQMVSAEAIDRQVKVDDSRALAALDTLRKHYFDRAEFMRETTDQAMSEATKLHFYSIFLVVPILLAAISLYYLINMLIISRSAIQKSNHWVDSLLDAAPDATVIVNDDGYVTRVSTTALKLFGYTQDELLGMQVEALIPEEYRTRHIGHRKDYDRASTAGLMGGAKRELKALTKSGKAVDVEINLNTPTIEGKIYAIATLRDVTERREAESKIRHQANYDMLTDLPNRFLAMEHLTQKLLEAERSRKSVAVLFIDLDNFKKINDTMGHEAGDELLIKLSARLQNYVRRSDTIARLGGDEFIIILDNLDSGIDAKHIADNILKSCRNSFQVGNRDLIVTISVGIASYPKDGETMPQLLRNADTAMYRSKALGRNLCTFYTEDMNQKATRRYEIDE
jgi:diguanylate cyclase (GGDEF)-like protein/PAS domain S-box-containing protein